MTLLLPMLAVPAEPFDSPEHLFEIKWNGVRALALCESQGWRLWGRDQAEYTVRYPELEALRRLPPDTMVDGELVVLSRQVPNLEALLARHQLTSLLKIRVASQRHPVTYTLFDLLYYRGRSLLGQPLQARRRILQQLVPACRDPQLVFSEGIVGSGCAFFDQAVRQGHEGVMAKHRASRYLPGRRSCAWRKIKPFGFAACVIIGFVPGRGGLRSLLVAAPWQGRLQYVANVRSGFTDQERRQMQTLLVGLRRAQPVVACARRAVWVEPSRYCRIRFLEWTRAGRLRGASFLDLL
jgi:ATP-dependent DNA ligase